MTTTEEIRVRLEDLANQYASPEKAMLRDALLAVVDLCDQAPVNDDVGVMFDDEIEHAIAVALGLPGDPRHAQ